MKEIEIADLERALSFGDGLFETFYFNNSLLYAYHYHLKRMKQGAKILHLELGDEKKIIAAIKEKINQSGLQEARIKLVCFRSAKNSQGYQAGSNQAIFSIFVRPYARKSSKENQNHPIELGICQHRIGYHPKLSGIKHTNRLDQVIARNEPNLRGLDGLMLSMDGDVIETTSSNLMIYQNHKGKEQLISPNLSQYGIKGVMRELLIEQVAKSNLSFTERSLKLGDFKNANQVLVMNSLIGIQSVQKIDSLFIQSENQPDIISDLIAKTNQLAIESGLRI